jgi:hypothetical protein
MAGIGLHSDPPQSASDMGRRPRSAEDPASQDRFGFRQSGRRKDAVLAEEARTNDQHDQDGPHKVLRSRTWAVVVTSPICWTAASEGPSTTRPPSGLVMRQVWREVAPGEWRWLHVDEHLAPT